MITEELLSYIKRQRSLGLSDESIKKVLQLHGWREEDVTQAFNIVLSIRPSFGARTQAPVSEPIVQPKIEEPKVEPKIEAPKIEVPKIEQKVEAVIHQPEPEILKPDAKITAAPIVKPVVFPTFEERVKEVKIEPVKPIEPPKLTESVSTINAPTPAAQSILAAQAQVYKPVTPQPNLSNITERAVMPEGKGKKIFLFLIIGIVLLFSIIGAYAYFTSPARAISSAVAKDIKSFSYSIESDIVSPTTSATPSSTHFLLKGTYDGTEINNPKLAATFVGNVAGLAISGEVRELKNTLYFKSAALPSITNIDASKLRDRWIKIDSDGVGVPGAEDIVGYIKVLGILHAGKIYSAFNSLSYVHATGTLPDDELGGVLMKHVAFNIDSAKFDATLRALGEPYLTIANEVEISGGSMWIGKEDGLVYRIEASFHGKGEAGIDDSHASIVLSDFNSPFQIIEPAPYQMLSEIIGGANFGSATLRVDQDIKVALSSAKALALVYQKDQGSYIGLCSSPVGISKYLVANPDMAGLPACKDGAGAWAAALPITESGKYWCVDSSGANYKIASILSSTKCPAEVASTPEPLPEPVLNTPVNDAPIKQALANIYEKGNTYYATRHGYKYICSNESIGIATEIKNIKDTFPDSNPICHDTIPGFAVSAQLSGEGSYWCVDSTGAKKEMTSPVLSTVCQ